MNHLRWTLSFLFAAALLGPTAAAQQETAAPTPVIAVVDMEAIFQQLDERTAIEAQHAEAMKQLQSGYEQRTNQIKTLQLDLRMLDEGTTEWREKEEQIVEARAMARAWLEIRQQKIGRTTGQRIEAMRNQMVAAVAELAEQRGIDLVLNKAVQIAAPPTQRGQKPNVQNYPVVIWSNDRADLTDAVVSRMNAQFNKL